MRSCLTTSLIAQLTLYMFGIIGVWNFAGYLSKLSVLEYKIPAATFDSFGVAVESLFQVGHAPPFFVCSLVHVYELLSTGTNVCFRSLLVTVGMKSWKVSAVAPSL